MPKVVGINVVCNGSTGKIMKEIQKKATSKGYETISLYGRRKGYNDLNSKKFGNNLSLLFHVFVTFIFNKHNHASFFQTKKMVKFLKKYNPDIIHLHNIHGYYLNNEVLFNYLNNEFKGKVIWTLHDCWTFTGHCSHFDYIKCNKWKKECNNCPQKGVYPYSWFFDTSYKEYENKKRLYTNIKDLTIVVPSKWLKSKVEQSFFKDKKCIVINNGVDLNLFKPNVDENIYTKYNIPKDKKIILGVASVWTEKKGYNTFLELSKMISENEIIIMVGLTKRQKNNLPNNIIGIERTENVNDLVSIYSMADIFVNPTLEDTYPTTNLEAIACGTPVISYDTGGCKEQITKSVGKVVSIKDCANLLKEIKTFLSEDFKTNKFDNKSIICKMDSNKKYEEYIELYENINKK